MIKFTGLKEDDTIDAIMRSNCVTGEYTKTLHFTNPGHLEAFHLVFSGR